MKDRIGTTRSGKPIEIIWAFVDGIRIIESLSRFADEDDDFDVIAVAEAKCLLSQMSGDEVAQFESSLLKPVAWRKRIEFGEEKFWEVGARTGCTSSYDINLHGRSLLYPRMIGRGLR